MTALPAHWWVLFNVNEVDDEDEGATAKRVTGASGAVGQLWGDGELAASTDAHAGDSFLPPGDQASEGEGDGLPPIP